ncbi:MAG: hypothetical protein ACPHL6_03930 [Rubripirellula sp.]
MAAHPVIANATMVLPDDGQRYVLLEFTVRMTLRRFQAKVVRLQSLANAF